MSTRVALHCTTRVSMTAARDGEIWIIIFCHYSRCTRLAMIPQKALPERRDVSSSRVNVPLYSLTYTIPPFRS